MSKPDERRMAMHIKIEEDRKALMLHSMKGFYADAFDEELSHLAKGNRPETVEIVHRYMDGQKSDLSSLTIKQTEYIKSVKVLNGEILYSDSYLEI